jgi:predicted PurR-regulated permease PerM
MPPEPAGEPIPIWLRRTGAISWRLLAIAALVAVTIWLAVILGTVTVSILLSLVVAATFAPMVRTLRARGWSSTAAAAAGTACFFLIGVGAFLVLLVALVPDLLRITDAARTGAETLRSELEELSLPPVIGAVIQEVVEGVRGWLGGAFEGVAGAVAATVTVGILSLFLTFFVLSDGERAWVWLLHGATDSKRERIDASGREALDRVGGYLRGTAILSATKAAAYGLYLWVLDVPFVVPLAILVLLGGFVPYIGPLLTMAAVLLVALGTVGLEPTIVLLVLLVITNGIVNTFLRPAVYGRSVRLHPAVILLAIPAGAAVAGIVGVFAAIPATAFAVAMGGALVEALEPEMAPRSERMVSGWIDRLAQWSWRLLAAFGVLVGVAFVVAQAPMVVTPVVLALVIASAVAPLARSLRRRGWAAGRSATAAIGGTFLVIGILVIVAVVQMAGPLAEAVRASVEGAAELQDDAGGTLAWVESAAATFGGSLLQAIGGALEVITAVALGLLLTALLAFYFLRDGSRGWAAVLRRVAAPWRRDALDRAGMDAVDILGGYMFGTAAISAVGAVSQLVIMLVLDLPFAVPIAVLSFFACFIPYYGGFLTTGLALLIAIAFGSPVQIGVMVVYTLVFNIVQGNIVTPLVYNRAVNLHPAVVLLAIPAGGALAGIAGMFLAVPVLAVIAATWRTVIFVMGDRPQAQPIEPMVGTGATAPRDIADGEAMGVAPAN